MNVPGVSLQLTLNSLSHYIHVICHKHHNTDFIYLISINAMYGLRYCCCLMVIEVIHWCHCTAFFFIFASTFHCKETVTKAIACVHSNITPSTDKQWKPVCKIVTRWHHMSSLYTVLWPSQLSWLTFDSWGSHLVWYISWPGTPLIG